MNDEAKSRAIAAMEAMMNTPEMQYALMRAEFTCSREYRELRLNRESDSYSPAKWESLMREWANKRYREGMN